MTGELAEGARIALRDAGDRSSPSTRSPPPRAGIGPPWSSGRLATPNVPVCCSAWGRPSCPCSGGRRPGAGRCQRRTAGGRRPRSSGRGRGAARPADIVAGGAADVAGAHRDAAALLEDAGPSPARRSRSPTSRPTACWPGTTPRPSGSGPMRSPSSTTSGSTDCAPERSAASAPPASASATSRARRPGTFGRRVASADLTGQRRRLHQPRQRPDRAGRAASRLRAAGGRAPDDGTLRVRQLCAPPGGRARHRGLLAWPLGRGRSGRGRVRGRVRGGHPPPGGTSAGRFAAPSGWRGATSRPRSRMPPRGWRSPGRSETRPCSTRRLPSTPAPPSPPGGSRRPAPT